MEVLPSNMNTELVCVMATLGYYDGDDYFKGADCVESLKDLIRFLRREDDMCNIRRQMGHAQMLQKDLLPILIHHSDDAELMEIIIRLLVNLTSPAEICFNKTPQESEEGNGQIKVTNTYQSKFIEVITYLQAYKEAFTNENVFAAIGGQLGRILQMEWEDRGEDEMLLFERLLLLIRNILLVPASPEEEKRTDDDVSIHDQVLWNMHINGIDDLLIYITSSPDEGRWAMHSIEMINLMLKEQNPEKLAQTAEQRSESEKAEDTRALLLAKECENMVQNASAKKQASTRHSRFGGAFWVMNMKGVGNKNTLVHHKHITDANDISFDHKKYRAKVPKRKQAAKETTTERSSTLSIRLFLKEFSIKFLEHCFNLLMKVVKDNVIANRSQENDDSYYLWAMRFFMAFNRSHTFKVEYVSETLNMNTFHYILKQIHTYYDQLLMHKRGGWEPWQKRLHLAIKAYKELLTYILNMDKAQDDVLKDASKIIKNNVFYHEEYRSIFIILLRHYQPSKQTRNYLVDLIDTFHIFLKLLENFCQNKQTILVKTKKKKVTRKKKEAPQQQPVMTVEQLEELWENELAPSLSAILQGHEPLPDVFERPFDAASDVPVDEQRVTAMIRIQDHLRAGRNGEGVLLIRASREVWPDEEKFGASDITPESEFMIVRNLLFEEFDRPAFVERAEPDADDEEENEEEVEEEASVRSVEREFHLKQFLNLLVSPQILMPYNLLFKDYKINTPFTNHSVVKLLHRVAVDMKYPEMLFQLSVFITFKEILNEPSSQFKELVGFAKYIVSKFFTAASNKPNIFVETLFWKGTGDCYQISEREKENFGGAKALEKWTFEDEEELKTLYDQFKEDDDIVNEILKNVTDKDRTRRQITNRLVRLHLIENAKQLPKPKKVKPPAWTEEQSEELHRIYDEVKLSHDPVENIMHALTFNKSKNAIIKQLLATGKVADRKELHKKRRKKNHQFKDLVNGNRGDGSASSDSNESDANEATMVNEDANYHLNDDDVDVSYSALDNDESANMSFNEMVIKIKEMGYTQQVSWLQTRLRRAAEGREEDSEWYAVPLLTMTEEDEHCLRNHTFKKLLKTIGLKPPANEQETFWRIPDSLTPDHLRTFANNLDISIVKKILNNQSNHTSSVNQSSETSSFANQSNETSNVGQSIEMNVERNSPISGHLENEVTKGIKRGLVISASESSDYDEGDKVVKNKTKRKRLIEDEIEHSSDKDETQDVDDSVPLHMLIRNKKILEPIIDSDHDMNSAENLMESNEITPGNGKFFVENNETKLFNGENSTKSCNGIGNKLNSKGSETIDAQSKLSTHVSDEEQTSDSADHSALNFSLRISDEEDVTR